MQFSVVTVVGNTTQSMAVFFDINKTASETIAAVSLSTPCFRKKIHSYYWLGIVR